MRSRTAVYLMSVLLTASCGLASSKSLPGSPSNAQVDKANPISGDWNATFEVEGIKVPFRFKLRLEGDKVTGTAESEHTGAGTLKDGSYSDEKLAFTMVFPKHESIAVSGKLEGSKLRGEFATEGRKGTWYAELAGSAAAH
ncbi:MAG: hypothetical protein QOH31_3607 [Verrucomicrobiota bacterium]|jgi:hypothetical protein